MAPVAAQEGGPPTPEEVRHICAIPEHTLRNLKITLSYYRLSTAFSSRTGMCASWLSFAAWASAQAGQTIRGEDLIEALTLNTLTGSVFSHPIRNLWRWLLRKGLFDPQTVFGRIVKTIPGPLDALERARNAVAAGNLKVFQEIGLDFACYLAAEDPGSYVPIHAELAEPFASYTRQSLASEPVAKAQWLLLGTVQIGVHEQNRLQAEIESALAAGPDTLEDHGKLLLQAVYPPARNWKAFVRRPLAAMLRPIARSFRKQARALLREVITRRLMSLSLPITTIGLGSDIDRKITPELDRIINPELSVLLERFLEAPGEKDWASFAYRMHLISQVFRAFQPSSDLLRCPFSLPEIEEIEAGRLPWAAQ